MGCLVIPAKMANGSHVIETRVVNLRHERFDVFIGRGSEFGNGYTHRPSMHPSVIAVVDSVEEAIARYREDLWRRLRTDPAFVYRVADLYGQTLGCYCKPGPCHGDVLARAAKWAHGEVRQPRDQWYRHLSTEEKRGEHRSMGESERGHYRESGLLQALEIALDCIGFSLKEDALRIDGDVQEGLFYALDWYRQIQSAPHGYDTVIRGGERNDRGKA